jgi:hypothetical protein
VTNAQSSPTINSQQPYPPYPVGEPGQPVACDVMGTQCGPDAQAAFDAWERAHGRGKPVTPGAPARTEQAAASTGGDPTQPDTRVFVAVPLRSVPVEAVVQPPAGGHEGTVLGAVLVVYGVLRRVSR